MLIGSLVWSVKPRGSSLGLCDPNLTQHFFWCNQQENLDHGTSHLLELELEIWK